MTINIIKFPKINLRKRSIVVAAEAHHARHVARIVYHRLEWMHLWMRAERRYVGDDRYYNWLAHREAMEIMVIEANY